MTDRELLERAAKAAGHELHFATAPNLDPQPWIRLKGDHYWNPLTDDGDALRLAVKLRLEIVPIEGGGVDIERTTEAEPFGMLLATEGGPDEYAATRRAIVRAAAAMVPA